MNNFLTVMKLREKQVSADLTNSIDIASFLFNSIAGLTAIFLFCRAASNFQRGEITNGVWCFVGGFIVALSTQIAQSFV